MTHQAELQPLNKEASIRDTNTYPQSILNAAPFRWFLCYVTLFIFFSLTECHDLSGRLIEQSIDGDGSIRFGYHKNSIQVRSVFIPIKSSVTCLLSVCLARHPSSPEWKEFHLFLLSGRLAC